MILEGGNIGSFEELLAIIAAGYVAGKSLYEAVRGFFRWLKKKAAK